MKLAQMTHPECTDSLRSDLDHGLIYGPYAVQRDDVPQRTCTICKGAGSWTTYADHPVNPPELRGTPAPCEFCRGTGSRAVLRFLTMDQWAKLTGLCVYCGDRRQKGNRS